ncbi:MAG: hypothetical protein RL885_18485 [Planctomycetota bacterium]
MFKKLFGRGEPSDPERAAREEHWRQAAPFGREDDVVSVTGHYSETAFENGLFPSSFMRVLMERGRANGFEALAVRLFVPTVSKKKSKKQQQAAKDSIREGVESLQGYLSFAARDAGLLTGKEILGPASEVDLDRDSLVDGDWPPSESSVDLGHRHDRELGLYVFPVWLPGEEEPELTTRAKDFNIARGEQYEAEIDHQPQSIQSPADIAAANADWLARFDRYLEERRVPDLERRRMASFLEEYDRRELQKSERGSFERLGAPAVIDQYLADVFKTKLCRSKREMQAAIEAFTRFYRFIGEVAEGTAADQAGQVVRGLTKARRKLESGLR